MEGTFVLKDYKDVFVDPPKVKCWPGCLILIQMIVECFARIPWLWTRVRPFEGVAVKFERYAYSDTRNWACSKILVRDNKGRERWHACFYYPLYLLLPGIYSKVLPGEKVTRRLFGRLFVIRGGEKVKVGRIY